VDFARALVAEFGIEIVSTGGTAKLLQENNIPVTLVEDITGFPEMLDGRVKTLHPKIHAAILADRDNPEHMRQLAEQGIQPIDMVVVNLYPFEETIARPDCTFEEAIEMIDIGGPCLLRAAAKNHKHVFVVANPSFYPVHLGQLRRWIDEPTRQDALRSGAFGAFWATTSYDSRVATWLSMNEDDGLPDVRVLRLWNWGRLRYGENPHQPAELLTLYDDVCKIDLTSADTVEDEPSQATLSLNNYLDANATLDLCAELTQASRRPLAGATPVACFIKHTNACGVGVTVPDVGPDADADKADAGNRAARVEAYRRAYLGDPNAAMGGILAVNFSVDAEFAATVMETYQRLGKPLKGAGHVGAPGGFFIEVWVAPSFDDDAVKLIRGELEPTKDLLRPPKKNWGKRVRLLAVGDLSTQPDAGELDIKRIAGGVLMQTRDLVGLNEDAWEVVTKRQPTESELGDLRLAWLVCKHTKSNAISICSDGMLIGNGAGQMSRVMSCRIATWLAKENGHADRLRGAAAASDAFFPFRDGPDLLMDAGVTAIIQPGGSKRDEETIAACDERGVAMIFTGTRHFRH
jgi:phosphoribosylaminoimidazolecarboxamide formyltransferase/IMP cyclohydrolase